MSYYVICCCNWTSGIFSVKDQVVKYLGLLGRRKSQVQSVNDEKDWLDQTPELRMKSVQ